MTKIEGTAVKSILGAPGIAMGRWFVCDSSAGKVVVNLPKDAIDKKIKSIRVTVEWDED